LLFVEKGGRARIWRLTCKKREAAGRGGKDRLGFFRFSEESSTVAVDLRLANKDLMTANLNTVAGPIRDKSRRQVDRGEE
jgi:hypothetical protein